MDTTSKCDTLPEYIEKVNVLCLLGNLAKEPAYQHDGEDYYVGICEASEVINEIQPVDVAPVRHGEWIVCGDGDNVPWMCSCCGKTTAHKYKVAYGKYCPNCGAKMDI